MRVDVQLTGVNGVLETLKSLPPELVSKRGGPVKLALKAGAKLIRDEAAANLKAATAADAYSTGLLLKNLIVSRGKKPFTGKGERYLVRVRNKSYGRKGKVVTTLQTANLLEYGSSQQPAEPWLRPAFIAKARQAINLVERELARRTDAIVRKLARQNRGRR